MARNISRRVRVMPREIDIFTPGGRCKSHGEPGGIQRDQHTAIRCDVLQGNCPGKIENLPSLPGSQIHSQKIEIMPVVDSSEPDLLSIATPSKAAFSVPLASERANVAGVVGDPNEAAVVPECGMIHERDLIALGIESDVANPAAALINDVAHRIFKTALAVHVVNNGQLALWIPVGPSDICEQFAGGSSCQRSFGEHAVHSLHLTGMDSTYR